MKSQLAGGKNLKLEMQNAVTLNQTRITVVPDRGHRSGLG